MTLLSTIYSNMLYHYALLVASPAATVVQQRPTRCQWANQLKGSINPMVENATGLAQYMGKITFVIILVALVAVGAFVPRIRGLMFSAAAVVLIAGLLLGSNFMPIHSRC